MLQRFVWPNHDPMDVSSNITFVAGIKATYNSGVDVINQFKLGVVMLS